MRPKPSGGASAQDAIDITLSDTEPVSSDAPIAISRTISKPAQSSGSDIRELMTGKGVPSNIAKPAPNANQSSGSDIHEIVNDRSVNQNLAKAVTNTNSSTDSETLELLNGKRIRGTKDTPDNVGQGSTSRLPGTDMPAAKRSRHASPVVSVDQPVKKAKSTARKSTQHITTAQRLRWQASRANSAAAAEETELNDDMTHEEAMRQAAAERRRSQSGRKASHSPTKVNAEAGPGPSTVSQWLGTPDNTTDPEVVESVARSAPIVATFESSPDPLSRPSSAQSPTRPLTQDGPIADAALRTISESRRAQPSPFQVSVEPGSWGHAVPMAVPQRPISRNKNLNPSAPRSDRTSGINTLERTTPPSNVTHPDPQEVAAQPIIPVRKGPTWKTAATPSPEPVIDPLPSEPIEVDELEGDESIGTEVSAAIASQSPTLGDNTDGSTNTPDTDEKPLVTTIPATELPTAQPTSPLSSLPSLQIDISPESDLSEPSVNPDMVTTTTVDESLTQPRVSDSQSTPEGMEETTSTEADHTISVHASPAMIEVTSVLPFALPDSLAVQPQKAIENDIIEIDDLSDSLPEDMNHVDLNRSRASSSGDSIEEIPADIARKQPIFSRPAITGTQSSVKSGSSQSAITDIPPTVEKRVLRAPMVRMAQNNILPEIGPSRRSRLKVEAQERSNSASSSSSGSPSKRQSNRLATKALTPIYNFSKKYTSSCVSWRQTIEMDGESDVEAFLSPPSTAESSGSSTMSIDGVERTINRIFSIPIVDSAPPPERRSLAIRIFDTKLIDDWNAMSPKMTNNPALHRLIFESYIDQCVEGDEPEIKVYNDVDFESIPPHFEFQYSNKMLYHESVPEPELGLGCDCEGGCSESSTTCSCLKRQQLYNYDVNNAFAYDKDGHLKSGVPIWECGPNCGCPPECMNRVIQNGRSKKALVDLFKTKQKGWGIRARAPIVAGTFLGIYSGEFIAEHVSEARGAVYEKVGRTYLFDCDGYHIGNPPDGLEAVDPRLAELARDAELRARQAEKENDDPGCGYNAYSVDAFSYGNFTRFFNHSCDPNLQIVQAYVHDFHPERPLLVIFTRRDVRANEELCISYKGVPDEEEVVVDTTKKSGKRRNIKKPKTTAAVHVSNKKEASNDTCYCKAWNCDGIMFNLGALDTDT